MIATAGSLQAVVLTAGLGRRMLPLTNDTHKALLPVGGTTILARIIDSLIDIGVGDVTIVTGYRAEDISTYLTRQYPSLSFRFVHNDRYESTNNIVSLALALDAMDLSSDVMLIECDLLFEPVVLRRLAHLTGNVALVDNYRVGMDGTVVSVADGMVTQVYPPAVQGSDFYYEDKYKTLNIYRFDADFCRRTLRPMLNVYSSQIDDNCYYELVLGMLASVPANRIGAEIVNGSLWAEVDDPNDLEAARFRFEPDARAEILDRTMGGQWSLGVDDFSFMRNVHFPTAAMIAAMRHALPELLKGYGSTQKVINEKLATFVRCSPDHVQTLHGATQAFPILRHLFQGRRTAHPTPTFGEFPRMFPDAATYADGPGVDLNEIEQLADTVDVLIVVNPNNPTGTTVSSEWLYDLARRHPDLTLLVDQSFSDFSGEPSLIDMLEREPLTNLIVLVSLSKVLGVPGMRLGFVYTHNERCLAEFEANLPIWNLSAMGEYFLELLLKYRTELSASVRATVADRETLRSALAKLPHVAEVYPSGGDFVLVRLAGDTNFGGKIRRALLAEAAIDVKDVSGRFSNASPHLRIGVRTAPENERFITALTTVLERTPA